MTRLLERDAELRRLERIADQAAAGSGRFVLVGGEAGIGKSSLIRALRERVCDRVELLIGACEPLSVPVPLAPLRELVEAAQGPDLAALQSADRLRLAAAVLQTLARRAPVVAVVEDAHWADAATVDVLRLLARRVEEQPVALVVTYRDDELQANAALSKLVGDVTPRPETERIKLAPLSEQAVRALATEAGVEPERLARVTGGNPFLVVESIAAGEHFPTSVRDAILARVSRLGDDARGTVEAAAVIGQRVEPALLDAVVTRGDSAVEQALARSASAVEEALARGVMVAQGSVLGFRHALIREALESSLSPPRRAELHARAFVALEHGPGARDAARLAHHAELAGLVEEACRYAAQAAYEAQRLGALREAALQSERALRLGASLTESERLQLLILRSQTTNFVSVRLEDAAEAAREAVALAVELDDRVAHGQALVALSYALWSLDDVEQAKAAAEQAVSVLAETGDIAALARARATDIRMEATSFDPAAAVAAGPAALELASDPGLEETRLDVAISVGLARGHRGDFEGLALLRDACLDARREGFTIQAVRSYVNQVVVAVLLRLHDVVDAVANEALERFDEYQTTIPGYAIELYRARSLLDRGRYDEARRIARRTDRDWVSEKALAFMIEALAGARLGERDWQKALERAWQELADIPENARHGAIRVALVEAAWLRGDHAAALAQLHSARLCEAVVRFARSGGELALWARRYGLDLAVPSGAPIPVQRELAGDWRGAIQAWEELGSPYEAALAALPGDERAARDALRRLGKLGASGAARAFARERAARGAKPQRGPRRSTLAHPAGLTLREQDVLEQLATGATNQAIAIALTLSERTVAHHVSAILSKLGAATRLAAVQEARARGLLAEDRQSARQR